MYIRWSTSFQISHIHFPPTTRQNILHRFVRQMVRHLAPSDRLSRQNVNLRIKIKPKTIQRLCQMEKNRCQRSMAESDLVVFKGVARVEFWEGRTLIGEATSYLGESEAICSQGKLWIFRAWKRDFSPLGRML